MYRMDLQLSKLYKMAKMEKVMEIISVLLIFSKEIRAEVLKSRNLKP